MPQPLENCTNYKCDHCGKKYFRKCDASRHERFCSQNPTNLHLCFMECKHLVRDKETYYGNRGDVDFEGTRTTFSCQLTAQKMFSYIAERKRLPVINEADTVRMPLECDKYTKMSDEDLYQDLFR